VPRRSKRGIGTIPARRRKRTKFVLLIKTDIARLLSGDDVDARTSRVLSVRGKRGDQSGANTAITVAFVRALLPVSMSWPHGRRTSYSPTGLN
jgi:hypothetical protein